MGVSLVRCSISFVLLLILRSVPWGNSVLGWYDGRDSELITI